MKEHQLSEMCATDEEGALRSRTAEPIRSMKTSMGRAEIKIYADDDDLLINVFVKGLKERHRNDIYKIGQSIERKFRENAIAGIEFTVDFFFDVMAYTINMKKFAKKPNMKYFVNEQLCGIVERALII